MTMTHDHGTCARMVDDERNALAWRSSWCTVLTFFEELVEEPLHVEPRDVCDAAALDNAVEAPAELPAVDTAVVQEPHLATHEVLEGVCGVA